MSSDHGYYFEYKDHTGRNIRNYHPCITDENTSADEILLSSLPLIEGDILKFRFDFGDDWNFNLRLLKNDPKKTENIKKPTVIMTDGFIIS